MLEFQEVPEAIVYAVYARRRSGPQLQQCLFRTPRPVCTLTACKKRRLERLAEIGHSQPSADRPLVNLPRIWIRIEKTRGEFLTHPSRMGFSERTHRLERDPQINSGSEQARATAQPAALAGRILINYVRFC